MRKKQRTRERERYEGHGRLTVKVETKMALKERENSEGLRVK